MKKITSQIWNAREGKFYETICVRTIESERTLLGKVIDAWEEKWENQIDMFGINVGYECASFCT